MLLNDWVFTPNTYLLFVLGLQNRRRIRRNADHFEVEWQHSASMNKLRNVKFQKPLCTYTKQFANGLGWIPVQIHMFAQIDCLCVKPWRASPTSADVVNEWTHQGIGQHCPQTTRIPHCQSIAEYLLCQNRWIKGQRADPTRTVYDKKWAFLKESEVREESVRQASECDDSKTACQDH